MSSSRRLKQKKNAPFTPKIIQRQVQKPASVIYSNHINANTYYDQAIQAYSARNWAEASRFARACIALAQKDETLRHDAMNLLAIVLSMSSQLKEAIAVWQELEKVLPDDVAILSNIGMALIYLQDYEKAIQYLLHAVQIMPSYIKAHLNLGIAFFKIGDLVRARLSLQQALIWDPKCVEAQFHLAKVLEDEGELAAANDAYRITLRLDPNHTLALGNMLYMQYYLYPFNLSEQVELVRSYGHKLENMVQPIDQIRSNKLIQHSPLKVGFISADLRQHPVGYFLESTLNQLKTNPELHHQLTLVAYHNHKIVDEYTNRLHTYFDHWYQVNDWNDNRLAEQIQHDQIDILIDLSGHSRGHRLPVFAMKPAPLQVSWLGYWGSTGLSSIDYVLTDPICVPIHEDKWFIEKVWQLPHLRYCFSIPNEAPDISPAPCLRRQQVVFGCYQKLSKINVGVLHCWSRILEACPNAILRIQTMDFNNDTLKSNFLRSLHALKVDITRIDLIGGMRRQEYFSSYAEVDILLDTFPYPGGTTTIEALWMGVPTLTLPTEGMLGRQGEALLVNAGLSEWIASSEDHYVQKAIGWANADEQKRLELAQLRQGMREQVRKSPLFNAEQFTQDLVKAIYGMWHEKCVEN